MYITNGCHRLCYKPSDEVPSGFDEFRQHWLGTYSNVPQLNTNPVIIPTVIFLYKYFLHGIENTALDQCTDFHLRAQHEPAIPASAFLPLPSSLLRANPTRQTWIPYNPSRLYMSRVYLQSLSSTTTYPRYSS